MKRISELTTSERFWIAVGITIYLFGVVSIIEQYYNNSTPEDFTKIRQIVHFIGLAVTLSGSIYFAICVLGFLGALVVTGIIKLNDWLDKWE